MTTYVSAAALRAPLLGALFVCAISTVATAQSIAAPWTAADIGDPDLNGRATQSSGVFTISAAGADIRRASDQFHFVYQPVDGDVEVIARVDSLTAADAWTNAGVMIRASLSASAATAYAASTSSNGVHFRARLSNGANMSSVAGVRVAAPVWVRAVRQGTVVTGYSSTDGARWTTISSTTIPLRATAYVGVAVTSRNVSMRTTARISNVKVSKLGLPSGQQNRDIGAPRLAGSATHSSGKYTIKAAGTDIWDVADQFHFVYQPVTGDVEAVARVASIVDTHTWAKAGVMIRESLSANARHAMSIVSAASGNAFQRRAHPSTYSVHTTGGRGTPPGWVKLVRRGDLFESFRSPDGVAWTKIGSDTIPMSDTVYVGLAATSHNAAMATTTEIDNLKITAATPSGNRSPAVSVTTPVSGTRVTAPAAVNITATAIDPEKRMASVDFYVGSTMILRDTMEPYSASWSAGAAGTYALTAVAYDQDGGSSTSSAVDVIVTPGTKHPPKVSLATGGTWFMAPATITLTAEASDHKKEGIARVEFFNGATRLDSDTTAPYSFSWTGVAAGTYSLRAVAYDTAGVSGTSSNVTVTVGAFANKPPTVSLSTRKPWFRAPATVILWGTAADPEGQLQRVEFFNGSTLLGSDTKAPYSFSWEGVAAGTYSVTAVAYDAAGASATSAPVTIDVTGIVTIIAPKTVTFTASIDHGTDVTRYVLQVFAAGVRKTTGAPVASSDLGKPTPGMDNEITVDRATFFGSLAAGTYIATVTAVGPGGETPSGRVAFIVPGDVR